MRVPLYFLHIPKAGGSTIRVKLRELFGEALCPALVWDDFYTRPEWREPRFAAYCGHFGSDLPSFLGRPLAAFTLLRDPVARTVSHYHEIRRSPGHPLHGVAARLDLWHYLHSPLTVPLVWNLQARYLAGPPALFGHLSLLFPPGPRYGLMAGWEMGGCRTAPELLWHAARRALDGLDFVATTEGLDAALPEMNRRYGLSAEPLRENVGDHHGLEPPDERTVERIRALTEVDRMLVDLVSGSGRLPDPKPRRRAA